MIPFRSYSKTYRIKKTCRAIEDKFISIAGENNRHFNEIYCNIESADTKQYSFYMILAGNRYYHPFLCTRLYAALKENGDDTIIGINIKSNPLYKFFAVTGLLAPVIALFTPVHDTGQSFITMLIVLLLMSAMDIASKKILQATFERFV